MLGYIGAVMIIHGLCNGSALSNLQAQVPVYVSGMVPLFALFGVASRRRWQRVVAAKLPAWWRQGLVALIEATWLGSIRNRRLAIGEATRLGGPFARKGVKNLAAQVVELDFVRDRNRP